ncbi:MAG TPA: protein translocase subunit SecD [Solirubrobacterales bacterium]|nr:protein translocase subunit SecD [Solirubrobacterales bacterium]
MSNRRRNLFVLAFVALLILGSGIVIATKKTTLGLDLKGGTELIFQARPTPQNPTIDSADMDRAIEIIRKRTDAFGVSEPEISRIGSDSIRVGLPDVSNAANASKQVGETAQMYFYDWEPNVIPNPAKTNVPNGESSFSRLYDAVQIASKQTPECFQNKCTTTGPQYYLFNAQTHAWIAGPADNRRDLFSELPGQKQPTNSQILTVPQGTLVVQKEPNQGQTQTDNPNSPEAQWFVIRDRPALSGTDITDPKASFDQFNQPDVTFSFSGNGRQEFSDVTKAIAQRGLQNAPPGVAGNTSLADQYSGHFAVVLDQQIKSRPIVNFVDNPNGIDGRTGAEINGLTQQESNDLAQILQIGALPVDLTQISSSTVSATLGQQALNKGLKAGIIGLILVCLFLLIYYRFLGFVAVVGLAIYGVLFFALIKLIPITLTLPGIAGLILTIGVAADANIVIFERIKEEARGGKSMLSAISAGYRRGIATIVDANVITLITAFILFALATSNVKGFAFTLGVGTIVSLFTAVVFTQAFLGLFGRAHFLRSPKLLGARKNYHHWRFDFTRASRYFFALSGCILLIGAISFATKQLNLGIDFKGGSRITVGLSKQTTVGDVRSTVEAAGISDAQVTKASNKELGTNVFEIDSKAKPDEIQKVQPALQSAYGIVPNGFDATTVGPTFGQQVANSAIEAIIFSLLVICAYVAFRFEPKYAVPVIIALLHDVLITAGVYSLTGREVTSGTVAAFLTILGYSLYDTVIVFDRIRENVPRLPRATFSQIVNRSMSEVLTRSLITGLSSVFLVTVLFIFGGATLQDFAFAMMVGLASGTYSSIFIASPVLTHWKEREPAYRRRRERIEEQMGGVVPAFPEDNVVARVDGGPEEPVQAETPVPAAAAPSRADTPAPSQSQVPGVVPEPPRPVAPPRAPAPSEPPAPVGADGGDGAGNEGQPTGDGEPASTGNGGAEQQQPELSEASAAALRRAREQGGGRKKRRKHGRNR